MLIVRSDFGNHGKAKHSSDGVDTLEASRLKWLKTPGNCGANKNGNQAKGKQAAPAGSALQRKRFTAVKAGNRKRSMVGNRLESPGFHRKIGLKFESEFRSK